MSKEVELAQLQKTLEEDTSLPLSTTLIFGEGSVNAPVVFVGEAPGAKEDELGRPFVGRSGQLLRECIRNAGYAESDVYITNIVKRRPPENRDPSPEEIAAYKPYLKRQIEIINPMVIVPLGRFSMNYFLPDAKITTDQGKVFLLEGRRVMPMLHPAAALRGTRMKNMFIQTFKTLPDIASESYKGRIITVT